MSASICPKCGKPIRGRIGLASGYAPPGQEGSVIEDTVRRATEAAGIDVSGDGTPPGLQGTKYGIPGDPSTWTDQPHVSTNTLEIEKPWVPNPKYLKHRLTLDDLRREQGKRGEVGDLRIVEFTMLHKPGDEVWWWDDMFGLAVAQGYALVRNGRVIAMLTTAVS